MPQRISPVTLACEVPDTTGKRSVPPMHFCTELDPSQLTMAKTMPVVVVSPSIGQGFRAPKCYFGCRSNG